MCGATVSQTPGWGCVRVWGQVHRNRRASFKGASHDSSYGNSASFEFPNLLANRCGVTFWGHWDGGEAERG